MNDSEPNRRILIVDDNPSIHADFQKLLGARDAGDSSSLDKAAQDLFGAPIIQVEKISFELSSACQGHEALAMVQEGVAAGRPFALAFVDVRMPPGWDGIETTARLWEADPELQIVICTAYSDYTWQGMRERLGASDRLLILKKPFDFIEVVQLANTLCEKWRLGRAARRQLGDLDELMSQRTQQLQLRSAALEAAPSGIVITDCDATIVWHNAAFSRLTGYEGPDVIGRKMSVLKSGNQDSEFYRHLWQTIRSGQVWRGELVNKRKSGSLYSAEMTITPVHAENSQTTHYVAIQQDVTERKVWDCKLRQAQKMEAVGQLAGGVAHDFNNILAAMMLSLEMLKANSRVDAEVKGPITELYRMSQRAAGLIRQLLMFSRRSVMKVEPLDLNVAVDNLLKMLRRLLGEHINLEFHRGSALPLVEADEGMMEQVLMNLSVNARDAMPKGGSLTIATEVVEFDQRQVEAHPDRRPGGFVCLVVTDTGCGIDDATLGKLFEPFFTTKEQGKGTGLGLATVHGIVKQHQGWVEVESQIGKGSSFRIFLPANSHARPKKTVSLEAEPMRGGTETILLVEDEPALRRVLATYLRRLGYTILEAANGKEALKLWPAHDTQIELLLTDMVMPEGITGRELSEMLRKKKPNLKIIISSGYNPELVAGAAPSTPGVVYLPKPVENGVLSAAVRGCLDAAKSPALAGFSRDERRTLQTD